MENRKKILLIGSPKDPHVIPRAEFLANHGFVIYIYTRSTEHTQPTHKNIHIMCHRTCRNVYIDFLVRIVTYIYVLHKIQPDIVHAFFATIDNVFVVLFTRVPLVVSVLGSDILLKKHTLSNRIDKVLSKWLLRKVELITAVSNRLYKILKDDYCITRNIIVQRYGVDVDMIASLECDSQAIKQRYGVEENDIVIFSPRHMKPIYNIEHVIEILKHVVHQKKNIKLLLRSCPYDENPDGYFHKINETIENYGLTDFVIDVDYLEHEEYLKIFSISDVIISMAFSDGSPIAVLEAMAFKKPVVCSYIPANNEIIKHGYNGIIVENNDPAELSREIVHLLNDKEKYRVIGENAYTFVLENADFKKEMGRMIKLYTALINNNMHSDL